MLARGSRTLFYLTPTHKPYLPLLTQPQSTNPVSFHQFYRQQNQNSTNSSQSQRSRSNAHCYCLMEPNKIHYHCKIASKSNW